MNSENLDQELKMAQIKNLEQMVAESQAVVEQMREDFRIAEQERKERALQREQERKAFEQELKERALQREQERKAFEQELKEREEERKIREAEFKEKSLERDAYIAKMRAETLKHESESKYLIWIPVVVSVISSITAIVIAIVK